MASNAVTIVDAGVVGAVELVPDVTTPVPGQSKRLKSRLIFTPGAIS